MSFRRRHGKSHNEPRKNCKELHTWHLEKVKPFQSDTFYYCEYFSSFDRQKYNLLLRVYFFFFLR